ncbi:transport-associated protein [Rhizobium leguminosarum]|uniref:transport-associated protein n=1 Tax=Rhizobium leguminosarum TaxID=384 RepID=UPI001C957C3B|nr:transport-associated protein [Rhizobium leguminosarum]MBY5570420.1 transport-associated protein [Rhizobium leguminosarum]MBY5577630.1 transport-associated protein [Rhizobium leguminosarum]
MRFGPGNYNHEERCSRGHSSASTIATIEAALSADPDIDSSTIEIRMLGPVVLSAIDDAQGRRFVLREGVVLSGERRNCRTLRPV